MANIEIREITTNKTSLTGDELVEGQEVLGGVNSSFNVNLDTISAFVHAPFGWSMHHDGQYTQVSPQAISTRQLLTSNDTGFLSQTDQMPVGTTAGVGFFNPATNFIEPDHNGDILHYRITMQATPSNANAILVLNLTIDEGGVPITIATRTFTFPNGDERHLNLSTSSFVIANYIASGAGIYATAEAGTVDVYDFKILVEKTNHGR